MNHLSGNKTRIGLLILTALLVLFCAAALADTAVDENAFPDPIFRDYVRESFDADGNGILSDAEIANAAEIRVGEAGIADLRGIEYFTALKRLYCNNNLLMILDVSSNTQLEVLYCENNQIKRLNLSENTALTELECSDNKLAELDVTNNTALVSLSCGYNYLIHLDIRQNTNLDSLECSYNQITELDVSNNTALSSLHCYSNQLTTLDVTQNTALLDLSCSYNMLTGLDLSRNTALTGLSCLANSLTELDVSNNTALEFLICYGNELASLDISKLPALVDLVKKTKPVKVNETLRWEIEDENRRLVIDEQTQLITDSEEDPADIGGAEAGKIKDQKYTGKAVKPAVVLKYNGEKLIKGTDYTAAYKNNIKIGTAKILITGKGNYTGTKEITFRIIPKGVAISSVSAGKQQLTVKWKKGSNITGYQLEYSTKKDFSASKKLTVTKAGTTQKGIRDLQAKKTYYIRIRTYKTMSGTKYFSAWSAVKAKKTN